MEEGEEEEAGPRDCCSRASSPLTLASYLGIPSSLHSTFCLVLGILGAVMFSQEGGGGGGAGGRVNSEMMMSCRESIRGFSNLHIIFVSFSEAPGVLLYNTMSRSESNRPFPTKL